MNFEHFLLTRFNVRQTAAASPVITSDPWLRRRFELFDQFCFPSVRNQSAQEFRWLVFFDAETPSQYRALAESYSAKRPVEIIYLKEVSAQVVRDLIAERVSVGTTHLITSRLDNDDALNRDFIRTVQSNVSRRDREVLNFREGYVWCSGRIYRHVDESNAFASMVEARDNFMTVWSRPHPKLSQVASIKQIRSLPGWLQTVHGQNLSNRVKGIRVPISLLKNAFGIEEALIPASDAVMEFNVDRWVLSPGRLVRETAIKLGKRIIHS